MFGTQLNPPFSCCALEVFEAHYWWQWEQWPTRGLIWKSNSNRSIVWSAVWVGSRRFQQEATFFHPNFIKWKHCIIQKSSTDPTSFHFGHCLGGSVILWFSVFSQTRFRFPEDTGVIPIWACGLLAFSAHLACMTLEVCLSKPVQSGSKLSTVFIFVQWFLSQFMNFALERTQCLKVKSC